MNGTTFCHYALLSEGPLVIEDTLEDPVYRQVPTVASLGVRAYLGIPLRTKGVTIGSFCAIDFQPRAWSPLQIEVMEELAASTMREIELRSAIELAQSERSRLMVLLAHVPAAVIFAEAPSGRVVVANQRAVEILGAIPEMALYDTGRPFTTKHADGRLLEPSERPLARTLAGETVRGEELEMIRADGTAVWIRVHGAPVPSRDGTEILGGVLAFDDVTEQRMILGENQRLYEEARSANQAQDSFFATVSHELRTPMTSILGWSKLLLGENLESETAVEAAEAIAGSARLQAQLIDDLLDASRIATGKIALNKQPCDLNESITAAVTAAQPSADSKLVRLRTHLGELPTIDGDPARLRQIIGNLLSNAIKFTPASGLIEVSSCYEAGRVVIVVCDTGRGIEPELLPHIFERHRQARSAEMGGLGLGLTIVRQLVELHGGEIHAESDGAGMGARFIVRL
jgi:PAS domain S-box-containing protein